MSPYKPQGTGTSHFVSHLFYTLELKTQRNLPDDVYEELSKGNDDLQSAPSSGFRACKSLACRGQHNLYILLSRHTVSSVTAPQLPRASIPIAHLQGTALPRPSQYRSPGMPRPGMSENGSSITKAPRAKWTSKLPD